MNIGTKGICGAIEGISNMVEFQIPSQISESVQNTKSESERHKVRPRLKSRLENEIIPNYFNCAECSLNDRCRISLKQNLVYAIGKQSIRIEPKKINLIIDLS